MTLVPGGGGAIPPGVISSFDAFKNIMGLMTYRALRPPWDGTASSCPMVTDTAAFTALWFKFSGIFPQLFRNDVYTWTIYETLTYNKNPIFEGLVSEIDMTNLVVNDILIFSSDQDFIVQDGDKYWCGFISTDASTGLIFFNNFNTVENLGGRLLSDYLSDPDFQDYLYVSQLRI